MLLVEKPGFCNQNIDYNNAIKEFRLGNLENSQTLLLKVQNNFPYAIYLLGLINEDQKKYSEALKYYENFMHDINPMDDMYYAVKAHQAYCFSNLQDGINTENLLNEIQEKNIVDRNINFITAYAALTLGDSTKDIKYANMALSDFKLVMDNSKSNDPEALNGYARSNLLLFYISKKFKPPQPKFLNIALTSLCEALKKKKFAVYYNNLATVYDELDDWKSAEKYYSLAIEMTSNNTEQLEKYKKNLSHVKAMEAKYPYPKITPIVCDQ